MIIGLLKEIKNHEYRVGLVPASVRALTQCGHTVYVQSHAGEAIGLTDKDYLLCGAVLLPTAQDVFSKATLIVKVKELQASEREMLRPGQILFAYLHLAPDFAQIQDLIKSQAVCIAYETVTDENGHLPLLTPMSEVAGRMAIQAGAQALEKSRGGAGILLSGIPGVAPANVVILGGGVVGSNAARIALGMHADVTVLDTNAITLRNLDKEFQGRAKLLYCTQESLEKCVLNADLVIGAVLIPGACAPRLLTRKHIKKMKKGSAVVDVAIDQGGCFETSHPTTHSDPMYILDGVVHYCVANMPGAVPHTSTFALNNATLPFVLKLANLGYREALQQDPHLLNGLNILHGHVTNKELAETFHLPYMDPKRGLSSTSSI